MRFDVVTLFPEFFRSLTDCGITARARQRGLWSLQTWNPRDVTEDLHRTVDDRPFGGGPGMILMAEPLAQTVDAIRAAGNRGRVVSFAPNGRKLDDRRVREFVASGEDVVLICGRYEGIDERAYVLADTVISLGDYVLTSGELASMVVIDAVVRKLPGVLGAPDGAEDESFADGLLEYPQYTRPAVFEGMEVPPILLSGNHAAIAKWRRERSLERTARLRPDLLDAAPLTAGDREFLNSLSLDTGDDA